MLTQLVRPLVRTQIQILANSEAAGGRLVSTIARWLGYLGVQAEVKQLRTDGDRIQVSLSVGKPEQCSEDEWRRILANLSTAESVQPSSVEFTYQMMTDAQQRKASRMLAHIVQVGNADALQQWRSLRPQLAKLSMDTDLLQSIQVALKVPQQIDVLLTDLDPDVAAFVLSRAIGIALMDKTITTEEDTALKRIYAALETSSVGPAFRP